MTRMRKRFYLRALMLQTDSSLSRVLITICGCVQGVGFRPFIYRLAHEHKLVGHISNTCNGVKIDVQGTKDAISKFQHDIVHQKPERATIAEFSVHQLPRCNYTSFQIATSESNSDKALALLPDTAMCKECLQELFDPKNRRYQYPFLHCISCGPRFSLFLSMPFDRVRTTMTEFCMCEDCKNEYTNPDNRRFFSQTNCCPKCGPQLQLVDAKGNVIAGKDDALDTAVHYLKQGKIVAMKNTGGYLLLVDASNEEAVQRLRLRKHRPNKPFAILMSNLAEVESIAHLTHIEEDILTSPAAPIVLLKKKTQNHAVALSVSHASPYHGIMLSHNALQHLLLRHFAGPLVATSGNISGRPLCITELEAFDTLSSIADVFLIHNRQIKHRLDDSIVHVIAGQPVIMRKARGYIPCAISVPDALKSEDDETLFAAGSQMKNSFAFLKQGQIYMSQYIGDLDSMNNCKAYDWEVNNWEILLGIQNAKGVGDKHPDYYSSEYLERRDISFERIQHHQAHVWAAMADNKLSPPFCSIAWDGTGWGDDVTVWGGEAFLATEQEISRIASLYPFLLPGKDKAVREPKRAMLGLFNALFGDEIPSPYDAWLHQSFSKEKLAILSVALKKKINAQICSSVGRLFDGVSAILDFCTESDFEGQAALLLEMAAYRATNNKIAYAMPLIKENNLFLLNWGPMIKQILKDKVQGVPLEDIALAFHETLAQAIVELAKIAGKETVLLTGGVMQNKLLVEKAIYYLKAAGFKPYIHRDIPPNDGGIAVGQLIGSLYQNQVMEQKICV